MAISLGGQHSDRQAFAARHVKRRIVAAKTADE
jgi:hypothetical protein